MYISLVMANEIRHPLKSGFWCITISPKFYYEITHTHTHTHGVVVGMSAHCLEVNEFELNLLYYVHFGVMALRKVLIILPPLQRVKSYQCCLSAIMTISLNNSGRLICHWTKERRVYIYNSILDIEHTPYYIALGSPQTHKGMLWQPTLLWYK